MADNAPHNDPDTGVTPRPDRDQDEARQEGAHQESPQEPTRQTPPQEPGPGTTGTQPLTGGTEYQYPTGPDATTPLAGHTPAADHAVGHPTGETASAPATSTPPTPERHARGTDPVTLVAGLLTVALAVYLLVGGSWNLPWVLAVGAIGVGVTMLIASVRPRRPN